MKRTTAGINLFRISSLAKSAKRAKLSTNKASEDSMDWQEVNEAASTGSETSYVNASDTLNATTSDNARLRTTNELQEKIFDIELDEPLLKDMRDDTRLVIVDIPGINEAGSQKVYLDYVTSTWDSFDAMIVVMVRNRIKLASSISKDTFHVMQYFDSLITSSESLTPGCQARCQYR